MSNLDTATGQRILRMPDSFQKLFMEVITTEAEHRDFLTEQLGDGSMGFMNSAEFQSNTHTYARSLSSDYKSERWECSGTNNREAFFIYPSGEDTLYELDSSMKVDNKIFGLLCSIVGLEEGTDRPNSEKGISNLFQLKYEQLEIGAHEAINHLLDTESELDELMALTWLKELISYYADC